MDKVTERLLWGDYLCRNKRTKVQSKEYITNADAGCGLVKYGSSLVPFVNRFPTNTRLYKLMTTKPGEDSINRGRM